MIINVQNFVDNLYYMGLGMAGIFAAIGIIVIITAILNVVTNDKDIKK